ncbi:unnamed protein product [marine sediment metagenome]|uniref:Uncharacterized protein n=1 Tax=marine sediment metagenome TaxID=412755 RepID=X0SV03_9ZZZZ
MCYDLVKEHMIDTLKEKGIVISAWEFTDLYVYVSGLLLESITEREERAYAIILSSLVDMQEQPWRGFKGHLAISAETRVKHLRKLCHKTILMTQHAGLYKALYAASKRFVDRFRRFKYLLPYIVFWVLTGERVHTVIQQD